MTLKKVYDNGTHQIWEPTETLSSAKASKISEINPEARRRIESLDWMLSRANRHSKLNKPQKKAELEVLQLQQDIEDASDAAIIAISALTTIKKVEAFTW